MTETKREYTFRPNQTAGRHGWLRLTPAYSVQLVRQYFVQLPAASYVLDPFSGTGTTGLVAAEHGFRCDLIDINPFLVWLARVKTAQYSTAELEQALSVARDIAQGRSLTALKDSRPLWVPPIHNIERWWSPARLAFLSRLRVAILGSMQSSAPAYSVLLVAFCRIVIETSNAAFNHQSMSFKADSGQLSLFDRDDEGLWSERFFNLVKDMTDSASQALPGSVNVLQGDARQIPLPSHRLYDAVITSPPYPNRMSYIRELRPYMYWLGFLKEGREAGELDWSAIGGTWGSATSRLQQWQPNGFAVDYPAFDALVAKISSRSLVLANYVHRYFEDISTHLRSLYPALRSGAKVFYVVGNSKFYDTLVPVQDIYAYLLANAGFTESHIEILRKRNSKKELAEYVVCAKKT